MRIWIFALTMGLSVPALAATTARGMVQVVHQATLSAEVAARVETFTLRAGDAFAKGDVLLRFDCAIFEAQRDKVDAEFRAAQAKLSNNKKLEAVRSIGALDVILSEVAVQQTEAELRMARINTDRCSLKAPWSGRVVQRMVNEHEGIKLNQELLNIVSTEALEVVVVVPSQWVRRLKPGQNFSFKVDETGSSHVATIITLGGTVDAASQTLSLRARIKADPILLPGMSGTATF